MLVDRVIKPSETRPQLIKALRLMLRNKKRPAPFRRHGNLPSKPGLRDPAGLLFPITLKGYEKTLQRVFEAANLARPSSVKKMAARLRSMRDSASNSPGSRDNALVNDLQMRLDPIRPGRKTKG